MKFWLGTNMPHWLWMSALPRLFVSHRRLARYKRLDKQALMPWCLDSGGFTELSMFGRWQTPSTEYVEAMAQYRQRIGRLDWAAPQDWMCEPFMLERTGLTVEEHQHRTILSVLELRSRTADHGVHVIPVLQGFRPDEYMSHVEQYADAGIDLRHERIVGLGSVCRRQATSDIASLIAQLSQGGLALHGFGVKSGGLQTYGWLLASADSMAWSFNGRQIRPCPIRGVKSCTSCEHHALTWYERYSTPHPPSPIQTKMF